MNDEPTPSGAGSAGSPDPLDDTQRVDVTRYAPTPDPRPDARWAWAAPSSPTSPSAAGSPTSSGERWYEPAPSEPAVGAAYASETAWIQPGAGGTTPPPAYTASSAQPQRRRSGPGVGTIVTASVLSAILAAGGTVLVLDRTGAFDRQVVTTGTSSGTPATAGSQPVTIDESSAVISAAAKVSPSVVKITTTGAASDPFGNGSTGGVGSGLIYDANGWILTNRHVVTGADKLTVELKDGRQFAGTVYGIDSLTDLAIVKVDGTDLPAATLGDSDGLKIGQLVVAIGSPLGMYSFSVTSGIVSGKGRQIDVDNGTRINNLIQTDAAINPGNSGGPLADASGAVVGINTAVATDSSGIGFAIPIDIAKPIMTQAVKGEALSRPWIGIRFEPINQQLKKDDNLPVDTGALVTTSGTDAAVVADSPAAKAGVQDGDIVESLNGIKIDTEHPLDALLVQFAPGETIQLQILRDGKEITVSVTLGTRPNNL